MGDNGRSRNRGDSLAKRKKLPPAPAADLPILNDDAVSQLSSAVAALCGPTAMQLARQAGVNVEDVVRLLPLTRRCVQAREKMGLTIKDAAKRLRVPQYRLHDIESGLASQWRLAILSDYLEILGLTEFYAQWSQANPEFAKRLEGSVQ
jgi:hypothetical protein